MTSSQPTPNPKPEAEKKDPHPKVLDKDLLRNSGKEVGLVDPNIVSVAPATNKKVNDDWKGDKSKGPQYKVIDDVSLLIGDDGQEDYSYEKLKIEQAFFVPTKPNNTTDNLLADIHQSINRAKQRYGEIEVDENGDEVWESVLIMFKKRNDDGTIQLEDGKPIVGANQTNRPKYIYTRNFVVKPVIAGQKLADGVEAEGDGVIVIRVA